MSFAIKRGKYRGDPGFFSTLGGLAQKGIGYAQDLGVLPGGRMPVPQVLPPGPMGIQINPPILEPMTEVLARSGRVRYVLSINGFRSFSAFSDVGKGLSSYFA